MSEDKDTPEHEAHRASPGLSKTWEGGASGENIQSLFTPDEMDLFVNKVTNDCYVFHGKTIVYDTIEYLEFDPDTYKITVFYKDKTQMNLGIEVKWLLRPYIKKADKINIVRTENRQSVDGVVVPLVISDKKRS